MTARTPEQLLQDTAARVAQIRAGGASGDAKAMAWLDRVLERNPNREAAVIAKAGMLAAAGDREMAGSVLREALPRRLSAPGAEAAARLCADLDDPDLEAAVLCTGVALHPEDMRLVGHVFRRALARGSTDLAARTIAHVRQAGADMQADVMQVRLCLKQADYDRAYQALRKSPKSRRAPDEALQLAQALIGTDRRALASRYLRRCQRTWPQDLQLLTLLVDEWMTFGEYEAAERLLRRAVSDTGLQQLRTANLLIGLYCDTGQIARALELRSRVCAASGASRQGSGNELRGANRKLVDALVLCLDLDRAQDLAAQVKLQVNRKLALQWSGSLSGQMMNELRQLHHAGQMPDPDTDDHDDPTTALARHLAEFRAAPHSTLLAMRLIRSRIASADARASVPEPSAERLIPALIHQLWDTPTPPAQVARKTQAWAAFPGHDHRMTDHRAAQELLHAEFGPDWTKAFHLAKSAEEKTDLVRLCLLAKQGGIWAGANTMPVGDIGALLAGNPGLVIAFSDASGAPTPDFIAARPGHPVIVLAARMACQALLQRSAENSWLKTGPGLIARALAQGIAADPHQAATPHPCADLHLIAARSLRQAMELGGAVAVRAPPADGPAARFAAPLEEVFQRLADPAPPPPPDLPVKTALKRVSQG